MIPANWIPSLLDRMAAIYGAKFTAQWSGVAPEKMQSMWASALEPYDGERVKWALDALIASNPFPPTLPEFVALIRQAPRPEVKKLPEPVAPKGVAQERIATIASAAERIASKKRDGKEWAREILSAPKRFPPICEKFARMALGVECAAASAEG